ncbi:MAG: methyl-accepting chemotaxis protein [Treponema sp.]|jgi:methyl-accepting chemotaxis protein|nr:methyl-accepting chemotaxis protein [Treponema sp.]
MKITKRLSLSVSLLVLAVSLVLAFIAINISTRIVTKNNTEGMIIQAEIGASLLEARIRDRFSMLQELANTSQVQSMNREIQAAFLLPYVQGDIDDLAIVDMEANAYHIKGGNIPNLAHREYVQKALKGEQTISDVIAAASSAVSTGFPVLNYVVPIKMNGKVEGGLLARTNAFNLSDIIASFYFREDSYAFMCNAQGNVIAHSLRRDAAATLENHIELAKKDPAYKSSGEAVQYILDNKKGSTKYVFDQKSILCGFWQVPGFDMYLVISTGEKTLMADVQTLRNLTIITVAVFIVISILVSIWLARSIAKPLATVSGVLGRIGEGDFTQKVNIKSKDEIGTICSSLNQSTDNVRELVKTIIVATNDLSRTGNDLSNSMIQAASAVTQINDNAENIKKRVMNQSASVTETNGTMKRISGNIEKLSDQVDNQSNSVAQSSSSVEQMLANIESVTHTLLSNDVNMKNLASAADMGRSGFQEVVTDIQEIARESEGLLEINSVMENIASQTNLLSMNAAIEAAHAGEAGKGFAVVADEIRKLAESSSEQSKTISTVLKKIKGSIDKIISSTNIVLNKFGDIDSGVKTVSQQEESIRLSMKEQNEGSKHMPEAISRLRELTGQVKTGSEEMQDGSKQIIQESQRLEKATAEISSGMNEMGDKVTQISTAVDKADTISDEIKKNIKVLVSEVKKFKVS